jgi:hypothetical protein
MEVYPYDIDMLLYTSCTAGFPKGRPRVMEDYHTGVTVCIDWRIRLGDVQMVVFPNITRRLRLVSGYAHSEDAGHHAVLCSEESSAGISKITGKMDMMFRSCTTG